MTVRDMIDRFHASMDSMNQTFWDDARSIALINRIKDRMAQSFHVNKVEQTYTFNSVADQQYYQVPTNFVANERLHYLDSVYYTIRIVDGPKDIYNYITDDTLTGRPAVGSIWGVSGRRQLQIYPVFAENGIPLTWFFRGWPPDVALDNDEPHLPIEWHPTIVEAMIDEQQAFDKIITKIDAITLWERTHIPTLKKLDIAVELDTKQNTGHTLDEHLVHIDNVGINARFPGGDVQGVPWPGR